MFELLLAAFVALYISAAQDYHATHGDKITCPAGYCSDPKGDND